MVDRAFDNLIAQKRPLLRYERQESMLKLKTQNLDDAELRAIIIGLWSILPMVHREDLISELQTYQAIPEADWEEHLPPVAQAVHAGYHMEPGEDERSRMKREEHGGG